MRGNFTLGRRRLTNGAIRFYARWRNDDGSSASTPLAATSKAAAVALVEEMNDDRIDGTQSLSADEALREFLDHIQHNRSAHLHTRYKQQLERIWREWERVPIRKWNRRMFERYMAEKSYFWQATKNTKDGQPGTPIKKHWKPRTYERVRAACKRFINWATDAGIDVPDFVGKYRGPPIHSAAPETLSPDELTLLLEASHGGRLEPAIALAGLAGLRHGEFMGLDSADVDWRKNTILVRAKKVHQDRHIPMSPRLQGVLKRHRRISGTVVRAGSVKNQSPRLRDLRALCAKAGVPEVSWHPLRHTFATIIAAKHPLHVVQALLGHSNVATTSIYLHAKDDDLRRAVEALG